MSAKHLYVDAALRAEIASAAREQLIASDEARFAALSQPQAEALLMACKGLTRKETAKALGISEDTVKDRCDRAKRRLGVKTMMEAAVIAGRLGVA